jgi:hypothetical protein
MKLRSDIIMRGNKNKNKSNIEDGKKSICKWMRMREREGERERERNLISSYLERTSLLFCSFQLDDDNVVVSSISFRSYVRNKFHHLS